MGLKREREIVRHSTNKNRLEDQYESRNSVILQGENISSAVVTVILGILNIILGLMVLPEPAISKIIGLLLAAGVSIFVVIYLIKAISSGSLNELVQSQDKYNEEEAEEDNRHDAALENIGNS